jgi:hypothetical protein
VRRSSGVGPSEGERDGPDVRSVKEPSSDYGHGPECVYGWHGFEVGHVTVSPRQLQNCVSTVRPPRAGPQVHGTLHPAGPWHSWPEPHSRSEVHVRGPPSGDSHGPEVYTQPSAGEQITLVRQTELVAPHRHRRPNDEHALWAGGGVEGHTPPSPPALQWSAGLTRTP